MKPISTALIQVDASDLIAYYVSPYITTLKT